MTTAKHPYRAPAATPTADERERARKASGRNPGDVDDYVALEMQLAKACEERDQAVKDRDEARLDAVRLARELQDTRVRSGHAATDAREIRASLDAATPKGTPSAKLMLDYKHASEVLKGEQERHKAEFQRDSLRQPRASFHDAIRVRLLLAIEIADVVSGVER